MKKPFYRAFEDKYRGSRETIKDRLQVYTDFIAPLNSAHDAQHHALDLGCGRGEWLEMLLEAGFDAKGVDIDRDMLDFCESLGLPVIYGDALSTLRNLPDDSYALISGFHIVEHMPFDVLQEMTAEALRVLRPGGLLIFETPNAENFSVGSHHFYLDPTHERPIPHLLLSFLVEYAGFARIKLLRLQESDKVRKLEHLDLLEVLFGASHDYAIVAQKGADAEAISSFDRVFQKDYGSPPQLLATRYEKELQGCFERLEQRVHSAEQNLSASEQRFDSAANQIASINEKLDGLLKELGNSMQQLYESQNEAHRWHLQSLSHEATINSIYRSSSWRLTAPLRKLKFLSSKVFADGIKRLARSATLRLARKAQSHPKLGAYARRTLIRFPAVANRLRKILQPTGISLISSAVPPMTSPFIAPSYPVVTTNSLLYQADISALERYLSHRALNIFTRLKSETEAAKKADH